jgi:hypothetical protein
MRANTTLSPVAENTSQEGSLLFNSGCFSCLLTVLDAFQLLTNLHPFCLGILLRTANKMEMKVLKN